MFILHRQEVDGSANNAKQDRSGHKPYYLEETNARQTIPFFARRQLYFSGWSCIAFCPPSVYTNPSSKRSQYQSNQKARYGPLRWYKEKVRDPPPFSQRPEFELLLPTQQTLACFQSIFPAVPVLLIRSEAARWRVSQKRSTSPGSFPTSQTKTTTAYQTPSERLRLHRATTVD